METDQQPPAGAAISRGGDDPQTTFAIFTARLDPGMTEALRTSLGLPHDALDTPFAQGDLDAALRKLSGD